MRIQAQMILALAAGVDPNGAPVLLGVGWTVRPPQPQPMAVQALIYVPREEAGRHRWRLAMTYADGEAVRLAKPVPGVPPDLVFEGEANIVGLDNPNLTIPLTGGPVIAL